MNYFFILSPSLSGSLWVTRVTRGTLFSLHGFISCFQLQSECGMAFCFGLAPTYDIFEVVSSGGVIVSAISEFLSGENPGDKGLKLSKD